MPKVPAVDQNRYHLSIANLAQFRAKFGTGKFFLFVFGQNQKSVQELLYGPVDLTFQNNVFKNKTVLTKFIKHYASKNTTVARF